MERDPAESTNLAAEFPETVEKLKKKLAAIIAAGRSPPGAPEPSDHADPTVKWPQIAKIRQYLPQQ